MILICPVKQGYFLSLGVHNRYWDFNRSCAPWRKKCHPFGCGGRPGGRREKIRQYLSKILRKNPAKHIYFG